MRKIILMILTTLVCIQLCGCALSDVTAPKDWVREKNKVAKYLEERYPEDKFTFEPPKKTFDTDGTGKDSENTWWVKCKSKKYSDYGIFVCRITEMTNDYFIKDSYQSVKFQSEVESAINKSINVPHYLVVNCYSETFASQELYSDYKEYLASRSYDDLAVYLILREKDLDNVKDYVNVIASELDTSYGTIQVIAIRNNSYKFKNTKDFIEIWDHVYTYNINPDSVNIPYAYGTVKYDEMDFDRFVDEDAPLREALQ